MDLASAASAQPQIPQSGPCRGVPPRGDYFPPDGLADLSPEARRPALQVCFVSLQQLLNSVLANPMRRWQEQTNWPQLLCSSWGSLGC